MHRWIVLACLAGCGGGQAADPRATTTDPGPGPAPGPGPGEPTALEWSGDAGVPVAEGGLPAARTYAFTASSSAVLPGDSREPKSEGCDGYVSDADRIDRVSVRATFYQNGCYTDGAYNARDYEVETGVVTASDGTTYEAFRVHPPRSPAQSFLASSHVVYYRFDDAVAHTLYALEGDGVLARARVDVAAAGDARLPIVASDLGAPAVFFVAPSAQRVSALDELAPGVEGGRLARTALGDIEVYEHEVDGTPFDTRTGFDEGPASWSNTYSNPRHFFPVELSDGTLGVVWQDTATLEVWVTTIDPSLTQHRSTAIANPSGDLLAAAASDGGARVFACFVQAGDGIADDSSRTARMVRADLSTGDVAEAAIDTSDSGLDIVEYAGNVASLAYADGKLGLVIGRRMHRSSDGLNHQGAIAVVFDAATLKVDINLGQTSGHSFENVMFAADGEFQLIDLGDNYPRGVHLHRFSKTTYEHRVVYTFKTEHGTTPTSPAGAKYPAYKALGAGFYQWSNDNRTYTELGGLEADPDGYTVVFATERGLDNRRTGATLNAPRNLGLVRVSHDLKTYLSTGDTESGGFYDFGGGWNEQKNEGVVWLTDYDDQTKANASRVRAVGLTDGNVLILWEQWTDAAYVTTFAMKIDRLGGVVTKAVELGAGVRLGRRDDVLVRGDDVLIVGGRAADHALEVVVVRAP